MRHSTELFAHFHTFSSPGWTSDPGLLVSGGHLVVFASRSTGKWVLLGDDVTMFHMQRYAWYAVHVCVSLWVEEFNVFPQGNGPQTLRWIHAQLSEL